MRVAFSIFRLAGLSLLLATAPLVAGTVKYKATETYTITVEYSNFGTGNFTGTKTFHGTLTGTLAVTDGQYVPLNKTPYSSLPGNLLTPQAITSNTDGVTINRGLPVSYYDGGAAPRVVTSLGAFIITTPILAGETPAFSFGLNNLILSGNTVASMSGTGSESGTKIILSVASTLQLTTLGVAVAPGVPVPPANASVVVGKSAKFTVSVSGTPPFSYQWEASSDGGTTWFNLANGNGISGATAAALVLSHVSPGSSGDLFRCSINNASDNPITSPAGMLTVGVPAYFTSLPVSQSIAQGANATFSVTANGTANLTYEWLKGKTVLAGETNSTLTLPDVQPGDAAVYSVTVMNDFGAATAKATLAIKPLAVISSQPSSQSLLAGQNAFFSVAIAKNKITPTFQWQVSTDSGSTWSNVANDATYSGVTTTKLTLTNAPLNLSGDQFRCLVTNNAGAIPSNAATLSVTLPIDFSSWTKRSPDGALSAGEGQFNAVAWNGTLFVAVGVNDPALGPTAPPVIETSPDGITWTFQASTGAHSLHDIVWNGTTFVAVGDGGLIMTSPDGGNWTARVSGTTDALAGVCWTGSQFLAVGGASTATAPLGTVLTSPNGITWTIKSFPATTSFNAVATNGQAIVAVGANFNFNTNAITAAIASSTNGATWTARLAGASGILYSVAWNGTQFVAVGDSGFIFTSPDGLTWTARVSGTTKRLLNVAWFGNQWVAVGQDGTILISSDGSSWISHATNTLDDFTGLAGNGGRVVLVGLNDEIRTADPAAP